MQHTPSQATLGQSDVEKAWTADKDIESAPETRVTTPVGDVEAARREDKANKADANVTVQAAPTWHKGMSEAEKQEYLSETVIHGEQKFHQLGWVQLVVVLIVEAIALGALSLPKAFATLGMVAGTIVTVGIGLIAIYTSYVVGQVKLKFPQVVHYADVGPLLSGGNRMLGEILRNTIGGAFMLYLILLVGSHCLTGTIAFANITQSDVCTIVWAVVSMVLLFICAIPPSFAEMAVLGYIDFVSIIAAILITLIATGIQANKEPGGFAAVDWSAWPVEGLTFAEAMVSVSNIVFAYSFAICQFSFMEEMHTPTDFPKAVWTLGLLEILIYTCTGAIGYAFIGQSVQAPALLSAGHLISRIAFGVALPVIFISGSINTVTSGRYFLDRVWANSPIRYVNTRAGWTVWLGIVTVISIIAFVIAEAIPFFSDLLGIISALFISGFSFYLPGIMWFVLIRQGGCFSSTKNIILTVLNTCCILIGLICLGCGTYGAVQEIAWKYERGTVGTAFSCKSTS